MVQRNVLKDGEIEEKLQVSQSVSQSVSPVVCAAHKSTHTLRFLFLITPVLFRCNSYWKEMLK